MSVELQKKNQIVLSNYDKPAGPRPSFHPSFVSGLR